MKIMRRDRQEGKSHYLVNWWLENPYERVVISANRESADYKRRIANRLLHHNDARTGQFINDLGKYFITVTDLQSLKGRNIEAAGIDDVEYVLPYLLGVPVDVITTSAQAD